MTEPDFSRLPIGERELTEFIHAVATLDDRIERHFLEVKSDVDLTQERGRAKVAKFILGAANRMPDKAAGRFAGNALLVLGVAKDAVIGIPPFEAMDLERSVTRYAGPEGPRWDFHRVRVSNERDVIVFVVAPPQWGNPVFMCHSDGPGNLQNGRIYVRAESETREATGDEVRRLLQRADRSREPSGLKVTILGTALSYSCDPEALEDYLRAEDQRLTEAFMADHRARSGPFRASASFLAYMDDPEPRTHQQYLDEIETWKTGVRAAWPAFLDDVAATAWWGIQIRVLNPSETFLEDVEVTVHLDGPVRGLTKVVSEEHNPATTLPAPPRAWGPKPRLNLANLTLGRSAPTFDFSGLASDHRTSVSIRNGESTTLTLSLKDLRPETEVTTDNDEVVLVVDEPDAPQISGTWELTARGHNRVYRGTLAVDVDSRDFTDVTPSLLLPSADTDETNA